MKPAPLLLMTLLLAPLATLHAAEPQLNVLLITSDAVGCEAMDFLDGKASDVTPNLSKLASEGLSSQHGFVNNITLLPVRP